MLTIHALLFAAFSHSFEQTRENLLALPRMDCEPDGAFTWFGDGWQLDGNLYDRAGRLDHVQLVGSCPEQRWDALLAALGVLPQNVSIQLLPGGDLVDEARFRELSHG